MGRIPVCWLVNYPNFFRHTLGRLMHLTDIQDTKAVARADAMFRMLTNSLETFRPAPRKEFQPANGEIRLAITEPESLRKAALCLPRCFVPQN